jgi:tetratricopeptide (TPR) repeat protein
MLAKRGFCFFFMLLFIYGLSYAGELASKEAINYFNEGVRAQEKGNFNAAKFAYQKTMLVSPGNSEFQKYIMNNVGIMFFRQGEYVEAAEAFRAALNIDPDYHAAKMNLGLAYDRLGYRLRALEYWVKVFEVEKMKPKSCILEGEHKGEEVKAEKAEETTPVKK